VQVKVAAKGEVVGTGSGLVTVTSALAEAVLADDTPTVNVPAFA